MSKTALVIGATGLVSSILLDKLLKSDYYQKVKVLSRSKLGAHDKMEVILLNNFDKINEVSDQLKADDIFCCIGTTMAKAKDKESFKKVDYNYPLALAEITSKNHAEKFLLISALGANKSSSIFYNRVKGQVEEAIWHQDFPEIHILRPSLLLGPREEKRVGEDAAKTFYKLFNFIFVGPLRKYKSIPAEQVAKAMLHFARTPYPGKHIHENKELLDI
jgi:uncharacterized protein YbjT (DUF2867 family)